MHRTTIKRETDLQIMSDWIDSGSKVLDMGCGRGLLLEYLIQTKGIYGVGVDSDPAKVRGCVERGVPVYQGDIVEALSFFPDGFFDWVLCSRTLPELNDPQRIVREALRVGRRLAVGFVNHGFWLNRWKLLRTGMRVHNDVYPEPWERSRPSNPVSVAEFENYCRRENIRISHRACLKGDWRTPCKFWPRLLAGYVVYEIGR